MAAYWAGAGNTDIGLVRARNEDAHAVDDALGVDVLPVDAAGADAFLLCSDGLTGMVGDDEIARLMRGALPDPRFAGEALIDAALAAGGNDNVTVVVVCPHGR